jgi:hypothetical protein
MFTQLIAFSFICSSGFAFLFFFVSNDNSSSFFSPFLLLWFLFLNLVWQDICRKAWQKSKITDHVVDEYSWGDFKKGQAHLKDVFEKHITHYLEKSNLGYVFMGISVKSIKVGVSF